MAGEFRVVLVDYGMGNVRSIKNALAHIGDYQIEVSADKDTIRDSDCLILPGVGAYPDAIKCLRDRDLVDVLNKEVMEKKKPLLGICLGMQLLFTSSVEGGKNYGLNWIPGTIEYINLDEPFRVPHIGWNNLNIKRPSLMFETLNEDKDFYFVHSYHAVCPSEHVIASFEYGREFTAAVQYKNIVGVQFHPEKSQQNGLKLLKQFVIWAGADADA